MPGNLTIILGPMFAGKSSAILQKVRRAEVLGWKHVVFTSKLDTRYENDGCQVITHDLLELSAIGVKVLKGVCEREEYSSAKLVVLEEAQFFPDLLEFVEMAVERDGKDVIVVGLDGDSDRRPFGQILSCIPLADEVIRLTALCKRCGNGQPARFTALVAGEKQEQICVGGADMYEPMCREHWLKNRETRKNYSS